MPANDLRLDGRVILVTGGIDGVFNNAGVLESSFTATADIDEPTWDRVIDVNLKGVWLGMKHASHPAPAGARRRRHRQPRLGGRALRQPARRRGLHRQQAAGCRRMRHARGHPRPAASRP